MAKPSCKYLPPFNQRVNVLNFLRISLALIHISSCLNKTLYKKESLNLHMTFTTCEYNGGFIGDLRLRRMEPESMWMAVHIATFFPELFLFKDKFISRLFQVPPKYV